MEDKYSFQFMPSLALTLALTLFTLYSLPSPSAAFALSNRKASFPRTNHAINFGYRERKVENRALFAAALDSVTLPPRRDAEGVVLPGLFGRGSKSRITIDDFSWATQSGLSLWERFIGGLKFLFLGGLVTALRYAWILFLKKGVPTTVYDARAKEAEEGLSKAAFFDKYGFVLVNSTSAMTAEDWEASDRDIDAMQKEYQSRSEDDGARYNKRMNDFRNADTPVKRIYAEECKEILRSIIPQAKTIMPPAKGIRRKIGGGLNKSPAKLVHNDYGLIFDEVVERNPFFDFEKQREIYEETKSDEYMLVNLWRPIKPMSTPLRSVPLCFLDASTLDKEDFVIIDLQSLGLSTALKENPNHKFYYYPDMTVDEVVIFKQFHRVRNETIARMPVFHTAFPDPAADENTEGRVSFEYRVGLLI